MKKIIIPAILSLALVVLVSFLIHDNGSRKALADFSGTNFLPVPTIASASTSVTTSAQLVLATSSARLYAVFSNDGTVPAYLNFTSGTSTTFAHYGILLAASSTYEITSTKNLYIGAVYAITASGTTTILVTSSQ